MDPDLLPERFRKKFVLSTEHFHNGAPCWEWTSTLTKNRRYSSAGGYGYYCLHAKGVPAHRYSYAVLVGPIANGLHIDHLCRNHRCVNPAHMEPVTPRINVLRGNTFAAKNTAKTHCMRGHEFTHENTYIARSGSRVCRTCILEHGRNYFQRNREKCNQACRDYATAHPDRVEASRQRYRARKKTEAVQG